MVPARLLSTLALAASVLAAPALAQLTVTTDAPTYAVGDVVTITVHNAGPSDAMFLSLPEYAIVHLETMDCIFGCAGLPIIWYLPAGEAMVSTWDTGAAPDQPGHYEVDLHGTSPDPGSIFSTEYLLEEVVPTASATWSGVKALYQ